MATSASIRAGSAFVEIFLKGTGAAGKQLDAFAKKFGDVGRSIREAGSAVSGFGLRMFAGVAAGLVPLGLAVKKAADFGELESKFQQVFGDLAGEAGKWAAQTADAVKRSKGEVMEAMSAYQGFFVGLGFGKSQALELSKAITNVALDLASFHNLDDGEAIQRLLSAMSGSSEVLDQFGINIKEAAVGQELLKQGFGGSAQSASEAQKALARLAVIRRAMDQQGATGDAARTSGSFVNQMKALKSSVGEAAVAIGQALIPALLPLVQRAAEAAKWAAEWAKNNKGVIVSVATLAVGALGASAGLVVLGKALSGLGVGVTILSKGLGIGVSVLRMALSPAGLLAGALFAGTAAIVQFTGAGDQLAARFGPAFAKVGEIVSDTMKGIKDAVAAGDLGLALAVLWAGAKAAFLQGVQPLREIWIEFRRWFAATTNDLWHGALAAWEIGTTAIASVWVDTIAFLKDKWEEFADIVADFGKGAAGGAKEAVGGLLTGQAGATDTATLAQQMQTPPDVAADRERRRAAREADRAAQQAMLEADRDRKLAEIGAASTSAAPANAAAADEAVKSAKGELAKARQDLADSVAKAAAAAGTAAANAKAVGAPAVPNPGDIKAPLDDLKKKMESRGTFNVDAIAALSAGPIDKVAENTKATAKNTKQLIDKVDNLIPLFG